MSRSKSQRELAEERSRPSNWLVRNAGDNTYIEAIKAAETGKRHILKGFSIALTGGVPATTPPLSTLHNGTDFFTELAANLHQPSVSHEFAGGLDVFGVGNVITLTLAASGVAGVVGRIAIWGITVDDESAL